MAEGFRAAQAFVEVHAEVDDSKVLGAARRAAEDIDTELQRGMGDTGKGLVSKLERAGSDGGARFSSNVRKVAGRDLDNSGPSVLSGLVKEAPRTGGVVGNFFADGLMKAATPLVVAMAPTLGAALAAGVVGGLSLGGVGAGIVLALRDPKIKAEAEATGSSIANMLAGSAEPFKAELLDAFKVGRAAIAKWSPMFRDIFMDAAKYMKPLTDGLYRMVNNILPGIRKAIANAEPVINSMRLGFDRIGDAIGDTFKLLANDAKAGASAMDDLTLGIENLIRASGGLIDFAAHIKSMNDQLDIAIDKGRYWIEDYVSNGDRFKTLGLHLDMTADGFKRGSAEAEAYRKATLGTATAADFATLKMAGMTDARISDIDASGTYRASIKETGKGLFDLGDKASGAETKIRSLSELLDAWGNQQLDLRAKTREFEAAVDDAAQSIKDNGKTLNEHTTKGRANEAALDAIVKTSKDLAAKTLAVTNNQDKANAVLANGREKFIATAIAMGKSAAAARKLADELFGIPPAKVSKVTINDVQAKAALRAIKSGIATVRDKTVTVTVKYEKRGSVQGEHIIGQGTQVKAAGGWILGGSGIRDDVPVLAMGGEFMLRKRAADALERQFGKGFLDQLNWWDRPGEPRRPNVVARRDPDPMVTAIGGVDRHNSAPVATPVQTAPTYHFASGAFMLDLSKIKDVSDLIRVVNNLTQSARAWGAA